MALTDSNPGSPDWYMARLTRRILWSQPRYDELEAYTTGNHPFPSGDRRYVKALAEFQRMCRTNYYGMVTQAPPERMKLDGIKFNGSDAVDTDAADMWQANNMDFQESMIHLYGATFGDAYVLVSDVDDDSNGQPVITMEDPRMCAVEYDATRPTRRIAGLRLWDDIYSQHIVGVLFIRDLNGGNCKVYYYVGPPSEQLANMDLKTLTIRLTTFGGTEGFTLTGVETLPIKNVPLVRYAWNPSLNFTSLAEAEAFGLKDVQDRINATVLDRMIITRSQAYKQRWATNITVPNARNGQKKPPFDPGSDVLWVAEGDAKFGEFSEANIQQILNAVIQDVGDIAAISKTPPHYLLGKVSNASGDALKAAESGLISKTKMRMRAMGWSHEEITRVGFEYLKNAKAKQAAQAVWADPEIKAASELADAGLKYTQMGLPLALAMQKMQFTPEEIDFAVREKAKQDAKDQAMMVMQNNAIAKGQAVKASGTGSAGAKPVAGNKPAKPQG